MSKFLETSDKIDRSEGGKTQIVWAMPSQFEVRVCELTMVKLQATFEVPHCCASSLPPNVPGTESFKTVGPTKD